MREKNFCLEEYVFFLREYPYDREHFLFTAEDGTEYEIYAVSPTGASTVPVPSDRPYSLSGDNIDGLIVTFAR